MKKIMIIVLAVIILLIFIIGLNLVKDFGINNLNKSIVALYQVKTNKDKKCVEIAKNTYMLKNKEERENIIYDGKDENELKNATFELYKDNYLYSVVKFEKSNS